MAYVYRHIRLDKNEPFYIGIGSDSEGQYKRAHDKNRKHNQIWRNIVAKTNYEVEILLDGLTWDDATKKEIELISLYGRINKKTGVLANMTDGGDGNLGLVHSAEALKKIGDATKQRPGYWKGKKQPLEAVLKSSETRRGKPIYKQRGKKIPQQTKDAVSKHARGNKYCLGRVLSEKTKQKIGDANRGRKMPPKSEEYCRNISLRQLGKKHSEERRKNNSNSQKKKPVIQYDKNMVFVREYISISEAGRENGFFATGIQAVCKLKYPHYKGFVWRYK